MYKLTKFNTGGAYTTGIVFLPIATCQVLSHGQCQAPFSGSRRAKQHQGVGDTVLIYHVSKPVLDLLLTYYLGE